MKTPKPGQFAWVNGTLYQARKREAGCYGCDLDSLLLCPNVTDSRSGHNRPLQCSINNIILKKV